jgi:four helix bundle protein
MASKYAIALREARETRYRLRLLATLGPSDNDLKPFEKEADEFVAMLTVSVRRLRTPADPPADDP